MYWRQVVSQSPTTADAEQSEIDHYLSVWEPLNQRILTGSSFSGNERNCCFLNTRDSQFADVSAASGLHVLDDSRSIAVSDWDHDGDLDIWLANRNSPRIRFLRNDTPTSNTYVAFELQGLPSANCPRDAYGARVEVSFANGANDGPSTRVQTLHGGDSFLSQSSKWLYFGATPGETIASVKVRWPGTPAPEVFAGAQLGGRWKLAQSTGKAATARTWKQTQPFTAKPLDRVPVKATGRLKISWPKSVGELSYRDFSDQLVVKKALSVRPRLFVCWASWCQPCLAELEELSNSTDLGGIEIVALNIERATSESGSGGPSIEKMIEILDRVGFEGTRGIATLDLLANLNQKHLNAIYLRTDLPLPVSFLIDEKGLLRVVYKGKLDVEQVAKDVRQLDAKGRNSMSLAVPFPGRWSEEFLDGNPIAVARTYVEDGTPADAENFLKHYLGITEKAKNVLKPNPQILRNRAAVLLELALMGFKDGNSEESLTFCKAALEHAPNSIPLLLTIIRHLADHGELEAVIPYCETVKKIASGNPKVEYQLGRVAMERKEFAKAVQHYRASLKANPKMVLAANNMAWILATNSDEDIRDGKAAVVAAKIACQITGYRDYRFFGTLAAAHAEAQEFEDAIAITKKGIDMAKQKGDDDWVAQSMEKMELFESGKPVRQ